MVNPILATIIKKAIKGGMQNQHGGGDNNEQGVMKFLALLLVVIILQFVVCDSIARKKVKDILNKRSTKNTTAAPSTTGIVTPTEAAPTEATPTEAAPTEVSGFTNTPTTAAPVSPTKAQEQVRELTQDELKQYRKAVSQEIYVPLIFINALIIFGLYKVISKGNNNSVKQLFTVSFVVMISSILISYMVKVAKTDKVIYFSEYIGVSGYTAKQVGIGMMTNIIFGFIDNFGLFFGMDSLDDFLNFDKNIKLENNVKQQLGAGPSFEAIDGLYNNPTDLSALRTAGWGNTFSDFLGAFVGNAVGDIAATLSGVDRTPIISEIVGIVIGCVLGIFIPAAMKKRMMGKPTKKEEPLILTETVSAA